MSAHRQHAAGSRVTVDLQDALQRPVPLPSRGLFGRWVEAALEAAGRTAGPAELTIRIVEPEESARLNRRYRHRTGPTNVLSFPFEPPPGVDGLALLGDLVICARVVERQAREQRKSPEAHWAHMVIHGTLHLLGYDHLRSHERERMESLEISILARLGYENPYDCPDCP